MPEQPPRTLLAINPGSRYLSYAAFRGLDLIDWGVRVIRADTPRGKRQAVRTILVESIERYRADGLVTKRLHPSRSSPQLDRLNTVIEVLARKRKLTLQQYSIGEVKHALFPGVKANKRRLAEHLVTRYPVLTREFQKESGNRHPYYLRMFEAVALGTVELEHHEQLFIAP